MKKRSCCCYYFLFFFHKQFSPCLPYTPSIEVVLVEEVTLSCCSESCVLPGVFWCRPTWLPSLPLPLVWAASSGVPPGHAASQVPAWRTACLQERVGLWPKWFYTVTSCCGNLYVTQYLGNAAACSPLPQVLTFLSTALLHTQKEDVSLAPKGKTILLMRMAWTNACCADSAEMVPQFQWNLNPCAPNLMQKAWCFFFFSTSGRWE